MNSFLKFCSSERLNGKIKFHVSVRNWASDVGDWGHKGPESARREGTQHAAQAGSNASNSVQETPSLEPGDIAQRPEQQRLRFVVPRGGLILSGFHRL